MPDAELELDAAPRDPTQMLDAFLVAAVRPPLRRLGPPAGRVVGLFVGLVAATTSLAYVGAHAADATCVVDDDAETTTETAPKTAPALGATYENCTVSEGGRTSCVLG